MQTRHHHCMARTDANNFMAKEFKPNNLRVSFYLPWDAKDKTRLWRRGMGDRGCHPIISKNCRVLIYHFEFTWFDSLSPSARLLNSQSE